MSLLNLEITAPDDVAAAGEPFVKGAQEAMFDLREKRCAGSDSTGWMDWPKRGGWSLIDEAHEFRDGLGAYYDTVVVVGIGGSYAGTRAMAEALVGPKTVPVRYAGHVLCEYEMRTLLEELERRQPLVVVISKSGTTLEPGVAFRVLEHYLEARLGVGGCRERIVAITDPAGGALKARADERGYRTFPVPPDIGGRYSLLSAVGIVPLALAGYPVAALMRGASQLFAGLADQEHPAYRHAALRRAAWDLGKHIDLLAYGIPRMAVFAEWWKQLYGESEGKNGKGLFPASVLYSTDLHSLGQFVQEGPNNMIETFLTFQEHDHEGELMERQLKYPAAGPDDPLGFLSGKSVDYMCRTAMKAARLAHRARGVPCVELQMSRLDGESLGYLTAYHQVVCALSALLLGQNPFDQPGVQAYKDRMFKMLGA